MEDKLKMQSKDFALGVIKLIDALPQTVAGKVMANQLVRSAASIGANYRAACRGHSKADFIANLGIVVEESDETCYWLELIMESGMLPKSKVQELYNEATELRQFI